MRLYPWQAGLIQSFLLFLYITTFSLFVNTLGPLIPQDLAEVFSMTLVLLAFVTSAFTCGAIALTYPTLLMFEGKHYDAVRVAAWNIVGLVGIACIAFVTAVSFF